MGAQNRGRLGNKQYGLIHSQQEKNMRGMRSPVSTCHLFLYQNDEQFPDVGFLITFLSFSLTSLILSHSIRKESLLPHPQPM